jgi:hypothetical protein
MLKNKNGGFNNPPFLFLQAKQKLQLAGSYLRSALSVSFINQADSVSF